MTQHGKKCTRKCKNGSNYCWQHKKSNKTPEQIQRDYCSCILKVKRKSPQYNPYAICTKSVGRVSKNCKDYGH